MTCQDFSFFLSKNLKNLVVPTSQPDTMNPRMVYQKTSLLADGHVRLHRDDLERMFHLPLADAACKIGLRSTTFKKTCRRLGVTIWPYRKQTKRRAAHTDTQIVTPPTPLRQQSLCAPASKMRETEQDSERDETFCAPASMTSETEQDHDSTTNHASRSTASVPSFFSTEGGSSSTAPVPSSFSAAGGGLGQHVSAPVSLDLEGSARDSAAVPVGARRALTCWSRAPASVEMKKGTLSPCIPCIEAVMDYLDACEVGGHSAFLFLLENQDLA